jgi:hypothetical protein
MSTLDGLLRRQALFLPAILLASCGEGGNSQPGTVTVSPSPTPPVPSLTPTPTPSPTPTPAGPPIANVAPGGTLSGNLVCAGGDFRYETISDGGRRLADATRIGAADTGRSSIAILYRTTNSFQIDINGFGGPSFLPSDRKGEAAGSHWPVAYFRKSPVQQSADELEIHDGNGPFGGLVNASLGRLSDGSSLCFFAVGSDRGPIGTQGTKDYSILVADGLAILGGVARRIGLATASARVDRETRTIDLSLDMYASTPPFGTPANNINLGPATARLNITASDRMSGALAGPGGSMGTIAGRFFEFGNGAGFVFDLTYPNGDRIFGSVAVDEVLN